MIEIAIDSEPDGDQCDRCAFFAAPMALTDKRVRCPDCGRELAELTDTVRRVPIPPQIIELLPESVAREHVILPFDADADVLMLLADVFQRMNKDTMLKLEFILHRDIRAAHADSDAIRDAIDRDYKSE